MDIIYRIVRRDVIAEIREDPTGKPAILVAFEVAAKYIADHGIDHGIIPDEMNLEFEDENNRYAITVAAKEPSPPPTALKSRSRR